MRADPAGRKRAGRAGPPGRPAAALGVGRPQRAARDAEPAAASPSVRCQPQEDEVAAGHRVARLRGL